MWISVKDALPEPFTEVLVEVEGHRGPSWRNSYMLVAYRTAWGTWEEERHRDGNFFYVTHWMPLPEPPKE